MRAARVRVLAVLAVLAVLLSGCTLGGAAPSRTSTPAPSDVGADLQPYYSQVLVWKDCGDGLLCASAKAPLTWSDPAGRSIRLALVRHPATGTRLGSLLVNPGGPGASGVDFVRDSLDFAVDSTLQRSYDIVGFDPRGVGASTPVRCYSDPSTLDHYLYDILPGQPGSDEWYAESTKASTDFGQECLEHTGPLLQYVDTASAARDLDLLRAVLGDRKLNYLGYSYGTFLGATYAQLYPHNTGRLVLDGALDPSASEFDVTEAQAKGFEGAMRAFLADCLTASDCPFQGSVDQAMQTIHMLFDRLDASPLLGSDGRELGSSTMFLATIYPLYNPDNWPALKTLYREVFRGQTKTAFLLADEYNGRNADGTYQDNSTEAFTAINCLDYPDDPDLATIREQAAQISAVAPVFGPVMAYGTGCTGWPFPPTGERGPISADGSSDILVLGTTNDPATPYMWAQSLASHLQHGHLVTYHGEGHTAYNKGNACVDDTVDTYFVSGTVPARDPDC